MQGGPGEYEDDLTDISICWRILSLMSWWIRIDGWGNMVTQGAEVRYIKKEK